jgi:hypothetical protein
MNKKPRRSGGREEIAATGLERFSFSNRKAAISRHRAAKCAASGADNRTVDPDLQTIADAWAGLPAPIRAAVLALVKAGNNP